VGEEKDKIKKRKGIKRGGFNKKARLGASLEGAAVIVRPFLSTKRKAAAKEERGGKCRICSGYRRRSALVQHREPVPSRSTCPKPQR